MTKKSYEEMDFAKLDTDRELRQNVAEVVFCEGKEDEHLTKIFRRLYEQNGQVLGTRASKHQYDLIKEIIFIDCTFISFAFVIILIMTYFSKHL